MRVMRISYCRPGMITEKREQWLQICTAAPSNDLCKKIWLWFTVK